MSEIELKPCPFCGNTKSVECVKEKNCYGDNYYYVGCVPFYGGCGASTCTRDTEDEAIEAWNRRSDNGKL